MGNAAMTAAFLEFITRRQFRGEVDFTAKRPGKLISVVAVTWDGENTIDANLAGNDVAKPAGLLWFEADAIMAVFEDIDIVSEMCSLK